MVSKKSRGYLFVFILMIINFLFGINTVNALTLQESQEDYTLMKLANSPLTIEFEKDLIIFPNNSYRSYGVTMDFADIWRQNTFDGYYYKYYVKSFNDDIDANTNDSTLYMSIPNTPFMPTTADTAYLRIVDSTGHTQKYSLLGSSFADARSSCDSYVRVSSDFRTIQIYKCGRYNFSSRRIEYDSYVQNVENDTFCMDGYEKSSASRLVKDDCSSVVNESHGLSYRYCSQVYEFNCEVRNSSSARLTNLSVSSGNMVPNFSQDVYTYAIETDSRQVTINAELAGDGAKFVSGYGPRTVEVEPGVNNVYIRIQSKDNHITNYTLKITNTNTLDTVNTLKSLSTSVGSLTPEFASYTLNYDLFVPEETKTVDIIAEKTSSSSEFVKGYEPRTVEIDPEKTTTAYIKVKSSAGTIKTYAIFIKTSSDMPKNDTDALLKDIELQDGDIDIDFEENVYEYNVMVGLDTSYVTVNAYAKDENDQVNVQNVDELKLGSNLVTIEVSTPEGFKRTYTLNIIKSATALSSNAEIKEITIEGYDSFKYEQNELEYDLTLHKGDSELKINVVPEDEKSVITIDGNKDLKLGSKIVIVSTAEDGSVVEYHINIASVEKGTNVFLVVVLVIIIILLLVYAVLRILGYKIYFNFSLIGSAFRSIGQKIKGIFDR